MATRNGNRHEIEASPSRFRAGCAMAGGWSSLPDPCPRIVETVIACLRVRIPIGGIGGRGVVDKRAEMASCWTFCVFVLQLQPLISERNAEDFHPSSAVAVRSRRNYLLCTVPDNAS